MLLIMLFREIEALKLPSFVFNWIVSFLSYRQQMRSRQYDFWNLFY